MRCGGVGISQLNLTTGISFKDTNKMLHVLRFASDK